MQSIEEIAKQAESIVQPKSHRMFIFKQFRAIDESHLWPISGKFNATERAIKHLQKWEHESGNYLTGYELCSWLDYEISRIVN